MRIWLGPNSVHPNMHAYCVVLFVFLSSKNTQFYAPIDEQFAQQVFFGSLLVHAFDKQVLFEEECSSYRVIQNKLNFGLLLLQL